MAPADQLVLADDADTVRTLTLNRPSRLNAFTADSYGSWRRASGRPTATLACTWSSCAARGALFAAGWTSNSSARTSASRRGAGPGTCSRSSNDSWTR